MNVTFHVLGSLATAAVLSFPPASPNQEKSFLRLLRRYAAGFITGVFVHGVLDFLPHEYPLRAKTDVAVALILLAVFSFLAARRNLLLLWICFAGAIFPDVADLSAGILNKHLGIPVSPPPFKFFPWHRKEYSGSIYDGSRSSESGVYHVLFLLICFALLYAYRKSFFKFWKSEL